MLADKAKTLTSPRDVIAFAKESGVKMVDVKFVDLPGSWQHFSFPVGELEEDKFQDGLGFDGSSIRGFQKIHESDMLLMMDPTTAIIDPACRVPPLSIVSNAAAPPPRQTYSRAPPHAHKNAAHYPKNRR